MMERSVVLVKPDGVARGLIGKIIQRFEDAGMKIIGMKMVQPDEEFALKHYTEDLAQRRGQEVRDRMVEALTSGPVVAICIEGVNAIEGIRKIVGKTEPMKADPGTIRGDFCHISFSYANVKGKVVPNTVHASGDKHDADYEVPLWFSEEELMDYKVLCEKFTM